MPKTMVRAQIPLRAFFQALVFLFIVILSFEIFYLYNASSVIPGLAAEKAEQ